MLSDAVISGLFAEDLELAPFLDHLPVGICVLSPERRVRGINAALEGLTGFGRESVLGKHCHHFLRCSLCTSRCPLDRLTRDRESITMDGDIIDRNRQKIPTRHTSAVFRDNVGKVSGYLEIVEDMRPVQGAASAESRGLGFDSIVGQSPEMRKVFQLLPVIAQTDSSVLITGETGTGKDMVAEAIHKNSSRSKGPFIKVNCGALPATLLESELFGHRKGAFTGAVENKPGWFRLAHNGTLFLTEIGDLPLALQVKLLTFLDDKVIHPLGSTKGVKVDVRVIAATLHDLEEMVRQGRFRQDLMFRLNVIRLHLPPLRDRGDDLQALLSHFLQSFATATRKDIRGFSREALAILSEYGYPGNVREMRNIVEYATAVCTGWEVTPDNLPQYIVSTPSPAPTPSARPAPSPAEDTLPPVQPFRGQTWAELEREKILAALDRADGRKSRAAELLGWGRSTLWRKMKKYNLD
jgi:transcriptional regulator with PAS, ATPase and Fis domain